MVSSVERSNANHSPLTAHFATAPIKMKNIHRDHEAYEAHQVTQVDLFLASAHSG